MVKFENKKDRCKGCGLCIEFCPEGVLKFSSELNSLGYYPVKVIDISNCKACKFCELICPDSAIEVYKV